MQPVCQELLDSLSQPYELDNEKIFLTASIGVTFYPQDAKTIDSLQSNADQAMNAAKADGSNRFSFFKPELQQRARRKRKMIGEMRQAIKGRQFEVFYQPVVELKTGNLTKAEALLRWHHPESGLVSPAVFIPIAEETGMIAEIGSWVFYQAIEQAYRWRDDHNPNFQISINTSPMQWIDDAAAMGLWFAHLKDAGISGQALSVEVPESLIVDARDKITNRLLDFSEAEIQIAIDDFGTGYSSMSNLKHFGIDYLKIDQSFVRNLEHDQNDLALCEATVAMAHKLGIQVVAEGVETEEQERLLREFGCDYGQGYLYSRPIPASEFEQLLIDWPARADAKPSKAKSSRTKSAKPRSAKKKSSKRKSAKPKSKSGKKSTV